MIPSFDDLLSDYRLVTEKDLVILILSNNTSAVGDKIQLLDVFHELLADMPTIYNILESIEIVRLPDNRYNINTIEYLRPDLIDNKEMSIKLFKFLQSYIKIHQLYRKRYL